jgi:hypothetical protein
MFLLLFVTVDRLKQTQTAECFAVYCDTDHAAYIYIYMYTVMERRVAQTITHLGTRRTFACKFFSTLSVEKHPV